jgi:hypothetical protein
MVRSPFFEEALAEAEGEVVDGFGFPIGEEFLVVAAGGEEAWWVFWGRVHRYYRTYVTYAFW